MPETIILGLDGANWNLLSSWLEEGKLPNIASLRSSGTFSDLESELPPVTCPNWRCYSTGKNPGKLGVYWWEKIDTETRKLSIPDSRSFKSANYWDYLNDQGLTAGIFNLPMTYPPFEVAGFMIAGGPGSQLDGYTYPEEIESELENQGYKIRPNTLVTSKDDMTAADEIVELIDDRFETFQRLLKERPVDVAHCTIFFINTLQHFFWRGEPTERAWTVIDEHVGEIREEYPEATLILMSDHGCTEIDTVFHANAWLEREGFLSTKLDVTSLFERLGVNEKRLLDITQRIGVREFAARMVPDAVRRYIPDTEDGAKRNRKLERVDWDESRAIASGQGLVYTIGDDRIVEDSIVDTLENLESTVSGKDVAEQVFKRNEVYDGPYVAEAPEIIFNQRSGVHTSGAIGNNPVFEETSHWRAENVQTGLFLADGPDIVSDIDQDVGITDIAPTILHSVGCPVPRDTDGRTLRLFGRGEPESTDPITPEFMGHDSTEGVEDRLEDLGYLQ